MKDIKELAQEISPLPWEPFKRGIDDKRFNSIIDNFGHTLIDENTSEFIKPKDAQFLAHASNNILPLIEALEEMASYAKESKLNNTEDFLEGLFECVEMSAKTLAAAKEIK